MAERYGSPYSLQWPYLDRRPDQRAMYTAIFEPGTVSITEVGRKFAPLEDDIKIQLVNYMVKNNFVEVQTVATAGDIL